MFVLLPGLDGTGLLMRGLVDAMGTDADVQVVSYPPDRVLGYAALVGMVRDALPTARPFLLVAESFSGPVGCALAASRPKGLLGLVLCASFVSSPFPALRRLSFLLRFAPIRAIPAGPLAMLLLGRWSSPAQVDALNHALRAVSPRVLRGRAKEALTAAPVETLGEVNVPVLYLRATADRLIPRTASRRLQLLLPSATVVAIEGPHFLLQAAPAVCAAAIHSFARRITRDL